MARVSLPLQTRNIRREETYQQYYLLLDHSVLFLFVSAGSFSSQSRLAFSVRVSAIFSVRIRPEKKE